MKYEVVDVPQSENCEKCVPCLRLRLMEMGFITGERIEFGESRLGLYMVNILTENDHISSVIALRQEELDRICLKGVL
jgi:Fe2+ transport system protein FeoA